MGFWKQARLQHWRTEWKSHCFHGDGQPSLVPEGQKPAPQQGHCLPSQTHHCQLPKLSPLDGLLTPPPTPPHTGGLVAASSSLTMLFPPPAISPGFDPYFKGSSGLFLMSPECFS